MSELKGTERIALVIVESEITETTKGNPESAEYVPCIVVEGKAGYYRTNWFWGKDPVRADALVAEYNRNLGLTPDEVKDMVNQSIKLQMQEESPYSETVLNIAQLATKYNLNPNKFVKFWQMRFSNQGTMYMEDWAIRLHTGAAENKADDRTLRALKVTGLLK